MSEKRVSVRLVAEGGRQVRAEFEGVGDSGQRAFDRIGRSADASGAMIRRLMGIAATFFSARQIVQYADTWTDLQSRVQLAVGSQEAGIAVMARLGDMARRTYSDLGQTVQSWLANSTALRELGMSVNESLDFTEALNNALVVSGARAERAAQVNNALSQAMALGVLRGDQLNTIIMNGGRVAELLAEEMGVTVNRLRALGAQGQITGDVIRRALVGNLELLREEADSMPATIGDAFTLMGNAALRLVGTWDQLLGASAGVAAALIFFGDNLERVAAIALALAGFMAGRWVAAFIAAQVATMSLSGALLVLRGALIRTGIGALIVAAGELIYQFTRLVQAAGGFGEAMGLLANLAGEVWDRMKAGAVGVGAALATVWYDLQADAALAMQGVVESVFTAGNAAVNTFQGAYDAIVVIWGQLPGAIGDFAFQAANALISGVEAMLNGAVSLINGFVAGLNDALAGLPDWVTGGEAIQIGMLDPVALGRIENQFEGAASRAGEAASAAFAAAFDTDMIERPDFGFEDAARAARLTADEFRVAYQNIFAGLTLPLESWEALRLAMVAAGADGGAALDEVLNAAQAAEAQLGRTGAAGGRAGREAAEGAEKAAQGWARVVEILNQYVEESMDLAGNLGNGIVSAFRSAENALGEFVRTGKLDFKELVRSILADMAQIAARRFIFGPLMSAFSGLFGGLGGGIFGGAERSYAGGEHTGHGARTGGLEGMGGRLALVHPQERIVDEYRQGGRREPSPVYAQIAAWRFIFGPLMSAFSGLFGDPGGGILGGAMRAYVGGGHTGHGARTGGLDGMGGRLALVHPQERIVDEYRQGGRREPSPVYINIHAQDAQSFRQSRTQVAADIARAVSYGRRGM